MIETDRLITGDCVEGMAGLADGSVDLAFCDPPFNIKYRYDLYQDNRPAVEYLAWSERWIAEVQRVLSPTGTFWLAIGKTYVSELDVLCKRLGFVKRDQVVWHFTFGVNNPRGLTPSNTYLLYYVKDPKRFTFNADAIRIPSARQLVYGDKRANPAGRLPDNTWCVPRVCGTFKERANHPCQMPESILGRIIRACSNPGDVVLDPMAGSGTTLVVAKKLGRRWVGFELSPTYAEEATGRIEQATVGQPILGEQDGAKGSRAPRKRAVPCT
jgi:site-specific DNA-methyltransferase (adenine-specific)